MTRRLKAVFIFAAASLLLAFTFIHQNPNRTSSYRLDPNKLNQHPLTGTRPLNIAFVETGGSHDEVLAALVNMFGRLPRAKLFFYQKWSRYGIKDVMRAMEVPTEIPEPKPQEAFMAASEPIPDIVVSTTCELDMVAYQQNMTALLEQHGTYLFCVVHHADRWSFEMESKYHLEKALSPWIARNRVEFLALSPHTADFLLNKSLVAWRVVSTQGAKPLVRNFAPVFPIKVPGNDGATALSFGLQGDYGQMRRDYKMVFSRLGEFIMPHQSSAVTDGGNGDNHTTAAAAVAETRNVTLRLVGHGKHPPVPDNVKTQVVFDEELDYPDFYAVLSRTFALLPAFASDEYLDRKASSTVPASLIAGSPLVATKEIVDAYSYMVEDACWMQSDNETDFDVIARVLDMKPAERMAKIEKVKAHRDLIISKNIKLARIWTEEAFQKIGVSMSKAQI